MFDCGQFGDWVAATLATALFFGFMLLVALAPEWVVSSVNAKSAVSRGLSIGVAVIVAVVALTMFYTGWRNRTDPGSQTKIANKADD